MLKNNGNSELNCDINVEQNDGYYINNLSENSKKLIKCETITDGISQTHSCIVENNDTPAGYYLNAGNKEKLILCGNDGCIEDDIKKGYFYNTN